MTDKEKMDIASDCSHAVWEICAKHKSFNLQVCPIGANGIADKVLNLVLDILNGKYENKCNQTRNRELADNGSVPY